jgi:hypothetical protein
MSCPLQGFLGEHTERVRAEFMRAADGPVRVAAAAR